MPRTPSEKARVQVAFRLPPDVFDMLPPPSLTGERVQFVIDAIVEYNRQIEAGIIVPEYLKAG